MFLGAHDIKNAEEPGQIRMMVHHKDFIIFPTWNPRRLKDDIALVRLPKQVKYNGEFIQKKNNFPMHNLRGAGKGSSNL